MNEVRWLLLLLLLLDGALPSMGMPGFLLYPWPRSII